MHDNLICKYCIAYIVFIVACTEFSYMVIIMCTINL